MKSLFGKKRRKAVGQAFLNIFTILVPASITSEKLFHLGPIWKIVLGLILLAVLLLGWIITPGEEGSSEEKEE